MQTDLFDQPREERQVPCSPLDWEVFKKLLSDMWTDIRESPKSRSMETLAKYQTVIALGGYTGLRGSDLLSVTWSQLLRSDTLKILEGKTGKKRELTLNDRLRNTVKFNYRMIQPLYDEVPILHNRSFGPISLNAFNDQLEIYFERYGVVTDNPSSHTLRKTFGKRFYEVHGCSEHALVLLMDIFNHSTLEETRKYIGITKAVIANGYKMLD